MSNRDVGTPMLVNLPQGDYKDTGEGGLAFFFVIPQQQGFDNSRQVCIAGNIVWPVQDCQISPRVKSYSTEEEIDGGLLIGSTARSLWSEFNEEYFTPTFYDLTSDGKKLWQTLVSLYGEVVIVTLLDT